MFDWKFGTAIAVALAGVVVPIWLWRADLASKSLDVKIASKSSLSPGEGATAAGIALTLNGVALQDPELTVIEIRNDGERPILASDFEGSLEISVWGGKVVRAQVSRSEPAALRPVVTSSGNGVLLAPLLLNPADVVAISVITTGKKPEFAVRTRIAGISAIELKGAEDPPPIRRIAGRWAVALVLIFAYVTNVAAMVRMLTIPWYSHFAMGIASMAAAWFVLFDIWRLQGLDGEPTRLKVVGLILVASLFAVIVNRYNRGWGPPWRRPR